MTEKKCKLCGKQYTGYGNSLYCDSCREYANKMRKQSDKTRIDRYNQYHGHDPMGWYKKIVADQKAGKYSGVKGAKINSDFSKIDRKHARGNER